MKILFWFRKSEAKNQIKEDDPLGTIQCRITIDQEYIEIGATKATCKKSAWNAASQVILGSSTRVLKSNKILNETSVNLSRLFDVLCSRYEHVSPAMVKEVLS